MVRAMTYERREVARYLRQLRRTITQWRHAEREAQEREQAARQTQELTQEREAQAREQAAREAQERTRSDRLTPEEATRVEQLIAEEPAWRAAQDEARIQRLMAQLENPEARVEALLRRAVVWHAAHLEQPCRGQRTAGRGSTAPWRLHKSYTNLTSSFHFAYDFLPCACHTPPNEPAGHPPPRPPYRGARV
jgi:hypothetical protein